MRVVGGRLRGRALAAPKTQAIRPTADRLRESLFNILLHAYGDPIAGARVLDLFAGTGALGIEAASRGAAFVLFIDESAEARALLRENVAALGLGGASRIFRRDATKLGPVHPLPPFSLAFVDPPYGQDLASGALASARAGGWFTADALIVVEEALKSQFVAPKGLPNSSGGTTTIPSSSFCAQRHRPRLAPAEQSLDVAELQFHIGRAAVIALAGIGCPLHLAQQRIHLGRLEPAPGAHRAVTGHRRRDLHQAALEGQGLVPFAHMLGEVAHQAGAVDLAEQRRRLAQRHRAGAEDSSTSP